MFRTSLIPKDSLLHPWLQSMALTEVPLSYQVVACLSLIGALLRRNVWVDQVEWRVYPNLSVLLVGPSGIGKDVTVRRMDRVIREYDPALILGGKTMESIQQQLIDVGDPACAFIEAPEITAFLGSKDYQKSMVQELTDLLSTGEAVDVSLKGTPGKRIIKNPTITMAAGSTEEWLHKAMPDGSLEGGLFPRFIIIHEEYGTKNVPLLKYSLTVRERQAAIEAYAVFSKRLRALLDHYVTPREIIPMADAVACYERWYINRFKYFSSIVRPYANRSRDQVLRMAMLLAITRGHDYMEEPDIRFATAMMNYVARSIEKAAQPPSTDAKVAREIITLLPAKTAAIMLHLGRKYDRRDIISGLELLRSAGQIIETKHEGALKWVPTKEADSSW